MAGCRTLRFQFDLRIEFPPAIQGRLPGRHIHEYIIYTLAE